MAARVMAAADDREASKIELSHRRSEFKRAIGEGAAALIEAAMEEKKSSEPRLWRNTSGCDVARRPIRGCGDRPPGEP